MELNWNIEYDTEDIPVLYVHGEETIKAYADVRTFKLKNNTRVLPANNILHPRWKIDNVWYCRTPSSIEVCEAPPKISINVDSMREALDNLHEKTAYEGGFVDVEDQAQFKRLATLQADSQSIISHLGTQVVLKNVPAVKETLQLPSIEDKVYSAVYDNMLGHPLVIKAMLAFAITATAVFLYVIWTCKRLFGVKQARNRREDSNTPKMSKMNYLYAIFEPTRIDVDLNSAKIEALEANTEELEKEVEVIVIKIDDKLGVKIDEKTNV